MLKVLVGEKVREFPLYAGETIQQAPWYIRAWNYIKDLLHLDKWLSRS